MFKKLRRIFLQQKKSFSSSKGKKIQTNSTKDSSIFNNAPPTIVEEIHERAPSKHIKFYSFLQNKDVLKFNVDEDQKTENDFAITFKKLPRFRKSVKWQSSKPFAQNAIRYRFCYSGKNRFISSRSKNSYKRVSVNSINASNRVSMKLQ